MGVDEYRQKTARERRRAIISALSRGFDLHTTTSPAARFAALAEGPPRHLVVNADIDGVLASQMLSSVTGWKVAALVDKTATLRLHPSFASLEELLGSGLAFGVDVFSTHFPGVSNHPVHFDAPGGPAPLRAELDRFDKEVDAALRAHGHVNLSAWVRIGARRDARHPSGMPYKYPLGTVQVLLALLEVVGLQPKFFDRQYLPWLVAHCDGGLDTIRTYAWNAEPWWSALAAAVGPASHSEALYRLATTQRPNERTDVDRRLRYDEPERSSKALTTTWNLKGSSPEVLAHAVSLFEDLSGWPDPFTGGVDSLKDWPAKQLASASLRVSGLSKRPLQEVTAHLDGALAAVHMNFSVFSDKGVALGYVLPTAGSPPADPVEPV